MGCRVEVIRDGYGAWKRLASGAAACVVLDADVQGYQASRVIAQMREIEAHATTPVILCGPGEVPQGRNVVRLARKAKEDDLVRAVARSLASASGT